MRISKILFTNVVIIFSLILIIEIFFGYWFEKYEFGPYLRDKRIQKTVYNNNKEKITYLRDFYGFRQNRDIYSEYDTSSIKIIFSGGSTGDEAFLDYEDTIVGKLNHYFQEQNFKIQIYNASLSGKSLNGHIEEFERWFKHVPNLVPRVIIYYFGINDRRIRDKRWHDFNDEMNNFEKMISTNLQKSFFYEKIRKVKMKYFYNERDAYFTNDKTLKKKLEKGEFVSHESAKKKFTYKDPNDKKILENFSKNLRRLKKKIEKHNIEPVFITQIKYDINGEKILFFLNEELKNFAKQQNYKIIKLDELIKSPLQNSFIDEIHTNKNGSEKLSRIIYPELKKILLDKKFENILNN
jgi:lysophospholipase L1-like esterase